MYFFVGDTINQINFEISKIIFDNVNYNIMTKSMDDNLIIDINVDRDIIPQLLPIINMTYRLNNRFFFLFEQVDEFGKVISYGDGVTCQIFHLLAKELDKIIGDKFVGYNIMQCHQLGKIMYFCNIESGEKFFNLHSYFYHILTLESANSENDLLLLKNFKGDDYPLYYKQYMTYSNDISKLTEIDEILKTISDYMNYILTADLDDTQINAYHHFMTGYQYFNKRNKLYAASKILPISCVINNLTGIKNFSAKIKYSMQNSLVSDKLFIIFCQYFEKNFDTLTVDQKMSFTQNVTGSSFYSAIIDIIFAYAPDQSDKTLTYEISTCETRLTIYIEPTDHNIREILNVLSITDLKLKN